MLLLIAFYGGTLLVGVSTAKADAQNSYIGFRFGETVNTKELDGLAGPATRIVVETSNIPKARLFLLENPYRLIIDTAHTVWDLPSLPKSAKLSFGPITSYRYGNPDPDIGRLVLELAVPCLT